MVEGRRYTPMCDALPERLCQLLEQHGLQGAVLIQPSFLGSDNSYLLNTLSTHQDHPAVKFKGVVVLDPVKPPCQKTLDKMTQLGVIGVRLNLINQEKTFDYSHWQPLLSAIDDEGWHIELHCEAAALESILPVLVRNHQRIVIDHLGLVSDIQTCGGLKTIVGLPAEKLWVKNSAPYRIAVQPTVKTEKYFDELIRIYTDYLGAERLVWGSDWPFTQFEASVSYVEMAARRQ